jgi:hypothetical protein
LLATGILDNNAVAIVVAALFLPFLAEVLAMGFGLWSRDERLIARGLRAIAVSMGLPTQPERSSPLPREGRSSSQFSEAP